MNSPTNLRFSEFLLDDSVETEVLDIGPVPKEGRVAIVTAAGRDAVDAWVLNDEQCFQADGEAVWS